ncbi:hypothetical protein GYA19_03770 [Candidatus Beckwithbacteria bacterium]|nr:hypothetical protein [Candidatus Beckwithbacteria bacterium]
MLTSFKQGYYLGIDGGATKTEVFIAKESGYVLGKGRSGGSNPHNISIDKAIENIRTAIKAAIEDFEIKRAHKKLPYLYFDSACIGMAGIDTYHDKKLVSEKIKSLNKHNDYGIKKLLLVNDGVTGLKAGTDSNWGVCIVASTGCNCYGLSQKGEEAFAGDWGYIIGDQGSGFNIGRSILQQVIKEYDGRVPKTILSEVVMNYLKIKNPEEILQWVYQNNDLVMNVASLTKIITKDLIFESIELANIVNHSIMELIQDYEAVIRRLKFNPEAKIPLVLIGGLFAMKEEFCKRFINSIIDRTPNVTIKVSPQTAASGAIKIALTLDNKYSIMPESSVLFENPNL